MRLGKLQAGVLPCVVLGVLVMSALTAGAADAKKVTRRSALALTTAIRPAAGANHATIVQLQARNTTSTAQHGVKLMYTVPTALRVLSASPGCVESGGVVTCTIGTIPGHARRILTIVLLGASQPPAAPGSTTLSTTVAAGSSTTATSIGSLPAVAPAPFVLPACTRTITGTVTGSIVVHPGETVCIVNATVRGSVIVDGGGGLSVVNSSIIGSITARGATFVSICGAPSSPYTPAIETTAGSVTIVGTTGPVTIGAPPGGGCSPNDIGGALTLSANRGGTTVFGNTIGGGTGARANLNGLLIGANNINGSLTCSSNVPPPTDGGVPNTVAGAKTGQCAPL